MPRERSEVWKKFTKLNKNEARCKDCTMIIKFCGNTTNLWAHLHVKHKESSSRTSNHESDSDPDDPPQVPAIGHAQGSQTGPRVARNTTAMPQRRHETSGCAREAQRHVNTIEDSLARAKSFSENGSATACFNEYLMYMIVKDNMPLMTVQREGFKLFVKKLCPRYKMPSRKTLTSMLDNKFDVLQEQVKNEFMTMQFCSLTCDGWTDSNTTKSYLGVTVHYRHESKPAQIISATVGVVPLEGSHTGTYLASVIKETCINWSIPTNKVKNIVTDNASNMVLAANLAFDEDRHSRCFVHTLQLVATAEIHRAGSPVKERLDHVSSIVAYFHRSAKASDELKAAQIALGKTEGTLLKLIQRVKTRWNSDYAMIERFTELAEFVGSSLLRLGHDAPRMLSGSELKTLKDITRLLKPLAEVTKEMSAEKVTTASKVIPVVQLMKQVIEQVVVTTGNQQIASQETEIITTLKTSLLIELDRRFKYVESDETYSHATLLDPRFKRIYFKNPDAHARAIFSLSAKVNEVFENRRSSTADTSAPVSTNTGTPSVTDSMWGLHENIMATVPSQEADNPDGVFGELRHFLNRPLVPRTEDPLSVWESIKKEYPHLYPLASDYLSRVVTSVPSERLFSLTGNTATEDRNRLNPDRLARLVFMSSVDEDVWFSEKRPN